MSANNNSGAGKGLPLATRKRNDRRSSILKPSKSDALSSSVLADKRGQMEKRRVSFNQNILVKEFAKQKEKKQNDSVESSGSETSASNLSKVYETQANESFFQISTPTIGAKKRRITGLPDRLSIIPQAYKPDLEEDLEFEPYAEESPAITGKGPIAEQPPQQQSFIGGVVSNKENQEQILEPELVQQQVDPVPLTIATCNPDQFFQTSAATINQSEDMSLTLGATSVEVQLGTSQDSNDPKTDVHGPGGVPQNPTQQQQVLQDKHLVSLSASEKDNERPVPGVSVQTIQQQVEERDHVSGPSHRPTIQELIPKVCNDSPVVDNMGYKNMDTPVPISPLSIPDACKANDGSYCANSDSSLDVTCHDKSMFSHAGGTILSGDMSMTYDDSNIFDISDGESIPKGASEAIQQHVLPPTTTSHLPVTTGNTSLNKVDNPSHTSTVPPPATVPASTHVESSLQNLPPSTQNLSQTLETLPPPPPPMISGPVVAAPVVSSDISQTLPSPPPSLTQSVDMSLVTPTGSFCMPIEKNVPLPSTSQIMAPPHDSVMEDVPLPIMAPPDSVHASVRQDVSLPIVNTSVAPTYTDLHSHVNTSVGPTNGRHSHSFKATVDSKSGSTTSGEKTSKLPAALSLIPNTDNHAVPISTGNTSIGSTSQSYAQIHNADIQVTVDPPTLLAASDQSFTSADTEQNVSHLPPPPLEAVAAPDDDNNTQNRIIEKIPPLPKSPLCISRSANVSSMESTSNDTNKRQLPLPFASTNTSVPNIEEEPEPPMGANIDEKKPFNTSTVAPSTHAIEKQAGPPHTPGVVAPNDSIASTSTHHIEASVTTAHNEVADLIHHSFNVSAGQKHPSSSSTIAVSKKLAITPRSSTRTMSGLKSPYMPDYSGPNTYVQQRTGSLKKTKEQQLSSSLKKPKVQRRTNEPLSRSMQLRSSSSSGKKQQSMDPIRPSIQHGQRSMESSYIQEQVSRPSTGASLNRTGVSDTRSTSTFIVQPAAVHLPEPDEDCIDEEEEPNDRTFVIHTSSLHQTQLDGSPDLDDTVVLEPNDKETNWINEVSEIDFVENTPASNTPVPRRYLTRSASKTGSPRPTSTSKIPKLTPRRAKSQSASKASKARLERIATGIAAMQDDTLSSTGRRFDDSLHIHTPEVLVLDETVNQTTVMEGDELLDSTVASSSTGTDFLKRLVVAANANETINLVEEYEKQKERKRKEELERLEEEERKEEEELKRLEEERRRKEELEKLEEEKKRQELQRLEEEERKKEELKRLEVERRRQEELKRLEEEERKKEEERLEEERKRREEAKRLEDERKRLEELALLEEERKKREENERLEQERLRLEEEERQRLEEEWRREEERKKREENEKRLRLEEEERQRLEEERQRQEEERERLEEERRREEERKKKEEMERLEQERLRLEEEEIKRQEEERQRLEEERRREEERKRQEVLNKRIEEERQRRREEESRRQEQEREEEGEDDDKTTPERGEKCAVNEESKKMETNSVQPSILFIDVLRRVERKVTSIFDMINLRLLDDGPRHKKDLKPLHRVAYSSLLVIRCMLNYARSSSLQSPYCNIVIPDTAPGLCPNGNDGSGSMEEKEEWVKNLLQVMDYYINGLMKKSIKETFEQHYEWKVSFWCNEYVDIVFKKRHIKLRVNLSTKGILPSRPWAVHRCQKIESIHFSSLTDDVTVEVFQTHNFKHSSTIWDIPMLIQEVLQI